MARPFVGPCAWAGRSSRDVKSEFDQKGETIGTRRRGGSAGVGGDPEADDEVLSYLLPWTIWETHGSKVILALFAIACFAAWGILR